MRPTPGDGPPTLDLERVSVRFGERVVLDRVDLRVAAGEAVALHGPSGSGKSTLLRVIAGLLRPDTGRVLLGGGDITAWPAHRRGVGMVFQDRQLFPHLDVAANVGFGLRMHGVRGPVARRRVEEMLEVVGLADAGHRRVDRLSGGEAARVAVARALAPAPAVLLLDEPLTGLDHALRDRLTVDLRRMTAGMTVVVVTHDHAEARALADRSVQLGDLTHSDG